MTVWGGVSSEGVEFVLGERDKGDLRLVLGMLGQQRGMVIVHKASMGMRGCIVGVLEFVLAVWGRWMLGRVSFGDVGFCLDSWISLIFAI